MISLLAVGSALAIGFGGCGSSSHQSTTSTTKSAVHAVVATPAKLDGVPAPKGAVKPSKGDLAKLVHVSKGFSAHIQGLDNVPITQAVPTVSGDLNRFWSQEFASSGVQWPTVQEALVQTSPVQTQCSTKPTVAPTDPMFLCYGQPATFFWTVPWMQQKVDTDTGGVNLALGMAGMYADAVQDLFGFYQQLQQGQITTSQWQQQNLCLVGIYALSLNNRNLFEQADVQTVKNWLGALSGGNGSGAATSLQLRQAFLTGFDSGAPSSCGVQSSGGSATTTTTTTTSP